MNDSILLQRLIEGDRQAFSKAFERYWEDLFLYVARVIKDKEESMDIVQETFAALWIQRTRLAHVQSLKAYLYSIARHKTVKWVQEHIKRRGVAQIIANFSSTFSTMEEEFHAQELAAFIQEEIKNIPPKMREIFILSRVDQLSHREIAERLSISENTVKRQINYSLKYLKSKVEWLYFFIFAAIIFLFSK